MKCKNLIAMCAVTHQPCPHALCDGKCDEAACANESIPTFSQMVDIYKTVIKPTESRRHQVIYSMRLIAQCAGLGLDDKVALGENEWEMILSRLTVGTHPDAGEGGYSSVYIAKLFTDFKTLAGNTSKAIRKEYRKRSLGIPDIDAIPDVEITRSEVEELTRKQVQTVKEKMVFLRNSKSRSDRTMFVWLWFAFFYGVRPADIGRLKWDCIVRDPYGGFRLEYVPKKTEKKTRGRAVGCAISPSNYLKIEDFIGAPDEYVIPRYEDRTPSSVETIHGEYKGTHLYMRKKVNKFMREEVGVTGRMAGYVLRRDCSRWTIEHEGVLAEAQKLGHSPRVAFDYYTNINKLNINRG